MNNLFIKLNAMLRSNFISIVILITASFMYNDSQGQQYKVRQVNIMMGMKSESTIYVKGMRKRTESAAIMGMGNNPVTIEQCDLRRIIKLNDKKKLYYIEPFSNEEDEIIQDDEKAIVKKKPVTPVVKGGIITMWYNIADTAERKKIYGFTARHIWTYQKMRPSADACTMKDSIIIWTDGWYIDLPEFNCPVTYRPRSYSRERIQPDCKDRFVIKRSGKGKLGFPLTETRKIQMGNTTAQTGGFETTLETFEFTTGRLDSMLFEIPPGYTEAANEDALQDKMDPNEMIRQMKIKGQEAAPENKAINEQKKPGIIRIAVFEPKADPQVAVANLQKHIVSSLTAEGIDAVPVATTEEAKKYNCDYTLNTSYLKIKPGSKLGGLLKAVKNADPNAASSYSIEAAFILANLSDGVAKTEQKIEGKFEGKIDEAASKAADQGCQKIIEMLKQ